MHLIYKQPKSLNLSLLRLLVWKVEEEIWLMKQNKLLGMPTHNVIICVKLLHVRNLHVGEFLEHINNSINDLDYYYLLLLLLVLLLQPGILFHENFCSFFMTLLP